MSISKQPCQLLFGRAPTFPSMSAAIPCVSIRYRRSCKASVSDAGGLLINSSIVAGGLACERTAVEAALRAYWRFGDGATWLGILTDFDVSKVCE
jgi:hypothetical protein